MRPQGTMQRASRTRIAVALCLAGLVAGTLTGNLVGAGAQDTTGEPVAAPPTQTTEQTAPPAAVSTPPSATTVTTPPPADVVRPGPGSPAPSATAPAAPIPPAASPPAIAPPRPAAAGAPRDAPSLSGDPAGEPQPADAAVKRRCRARPPRAAGAPSPTRAATATRTAGASRSRRAARHKSRDRRAARSDRVGAPATRPRRGRARRATCKRPAPASTRGETAAGEPRGKAGAKPAGALRNDDGVPTLANPSTSLALPGPATIGVPNFFIDKFRIPVFLLPIYQAAGIQYGVRWEILAAINEIETDYGRNLNVSSAGALGWMQFMPATWKAYGVDANRDGRRDPFNPVDAIFAAARYLQAAGAGEDLRKAIFAYNHADWYVESVLMRARLIGGLPTDLVGSLSGLTQGAFPVAARTRYAGELSERKPTHRVAPGRNAALPVEADAARRGIDIFAAAGAPVIAVQDGRVTAVGRSRRLGSYVKLADAYGNTYTYAHLKKVAARVAVPESRTQSQASIARELALPSADPKPTRAATAGRPTRTRPKLTAALPKVAPPTAVAVRKERLFAHPARRNALRHGGARQLLELESTLGRGETLDAYFSGGFGLSADDVVLKALAPGRRVIAGTILGRIGTTSKAVAPHMRFEIRPAGRGAPRIDPKPILDGWKLLEATAIYRAGGTNPLAAGAGSTSIGQIMLMSKEALARRVLSNPRIEIYSCGRRDIDAGAVDRRVLATLEFLAASGLRPTVTSLECGHSYLTASGNVSAHSAGSAVDIAMINGIPILGHQGEGSITDITIRRLLTLQGSVKPNQIISLMTYATAGNTLALSDHDDHIHVGFSPRFAAGTTGAERREAVLKPSQWVNLIERLGRIDNPSVAKRPSRYAIPVPTRRASTAHKAD